MAAPLANQAPAVPNTIAELIAQVKERLKMCSIEQLESLLVSMGKRPSELPSLAGSKGISYSLSSRHAALASMVFPVRKRVDDSDMALAVTVIDLCRDIPHLAEKERLKANRAYGVEWESGEVSRVQKTRSRQLSSACAAAISTTLEAEIILEAEIDKIRKRKSLLRRVVNILDEDENYEVQIPASLVSAMSFVSHDYKPHVSNLRAACVRFSVAPALPQLDAFVAAHPRQSSLVNEQEEQTKTDELHAPPTKKKFLVSDHDDEKKSSVVDTVCR